MTENASMKDIIEALDEVCYKTVGIHYVPIQSLDIYETIEAPPKAVKTLSKLRAFADIKPQPNLDSIVSDIIILSLSEKNFVHELVRSRMPDADFSDHPVKDLILAIKSNLYALYQETLDKLAENKKSPKEILEDYFKERTDIVENAFSYPSKTILQFRSKEIPFDEAIASANSMITKMGISFKYIPILYGRKLGHRLPYQPNYKIRKLSEEILQSDGNNIDKMSLLADVYDYIFELMKTEENEMHLQNPTLDVFRQNIPILISRLKYGTDEDKERIAMRIESLFSVYFKERQNAVKLQGYVHTEER